MTKKVGGVQLNYICLGGIVVKYLKLRKVISGLLVAASLFALNPVVASAEWKLDSNGWWYKEDNSYVTGWRKIDGKYYFFSKDGYMARNTIVNTHALGSDGALVDSYNEDHVDKMIFLYPTNWIKSSLKGKEIYYLDSTGTNVSLASENMQGKSPEDYIKDEESKIKSLFSLNSIEAGFEEFNHNKVRVAHYSVAYNNPSDKYYSIFDVTFFNNNTAYMFTLVGYNKLSDETLSSFENLLRTVEFIG